MAIAKFSSWVRSFHQFIFLLAICAGVGAFICMFFISIAVGTRYIFDYSIPGALDISQIILVLIIFFPLAFVEKMGGHIKITVLYSRFSKPTVALLTLISRALAVLLFGLTSFMSLGGAYSSFIERETSWGDFAIPLWIPKVFIFIGCSSIFLYVLIDFFFRKNDPPGR